ncbi:uncharacterized protein M421DRAFT_422264 [Didymella exigua CBS 183.55]|uniref:Methyltransferase type 11 domain-containing protein n=1 Tax=Didymella exigua CBS 183.55 TaxID=1150837 RepID=A0A6A5RIV0_9PLEO|nr:uncharacterized protein M421DRAFT_422264 [Didymella exigua CBS 183.55]KAF1927028.1 hypothetical protein M421DRAFT_422264 [Didymella exigua CBS 183.55]
MSLPHFGPAKESIRRSEGTVSFRTLDMEEELSAPGICQESFDVVVASNVLRATSDVRRVL